jgi:hypothetical protein
LTWNNTVGRRAAAHSQPINSKGPVLFQLEGNKMAHVRIRSGLGTILQVPKVKCQTLGNGYLGQNKEKLRINFFPKTLHLPDIKRSILDFLQNNFYLQNVSSNFYDRYVCFN